jgi:hypothetical protein
MGLCWGGSFGRCVSLRGGEVMCEFWLRVGQLHRAHHSWPWLGLKLAPRSSDSQVREAYAWNPIESSMKRITLGPAKEYITRYPCLPVVVNKPTETLSRYDILSTPSDRHASRTPGTMLVAMLSTFSPSNQPLLQLLLNMLQNTPIRTPRLSFPINTKLHRNPQIK